EFTARLSIDTQLGQDWLLKTRIHKLDIDNGYDAFSLENDRTTLSDEPGFDRLDSTAARLQLDYSGFEKFTIETAVNVLSADKDYAFDEDWTYVGIAPGWEYSSFDAYYRERDDVTAEIRFTSDAPIDLWGLPTDWTAGVYYYSKDVNLIRDYYNWDIGSPSIFGSSYETQNQAIYGELVQQVNDNWSWIAGLRVERYDNDYVDSNGVVAEPSDTMIGGNLSLRYQYASQSYAYATLARGYKAGGVNGEALGRAKDQQLEELEAYLLDRATFAPEILWNAEVGMKATRSDWSYRVAAFYNWRDDVQLKSWVNRNQSFVGYIENAAQGSNYGLEAELRYRLSDSISAFASLGWLDTEIDGFVTEDGMDMSGRDQAHAPNYQANIGLEGQ
ncbi:MAG: TonB-dependent receptor, partial [Pseudomonadota bacterium]|nr:TonB-dependent receptor [Pseudomonadota bacterium]